MGNHDGINKTKLQKNISWLSLLEAKSAHQGQAWWTKAFRPYITRAPYSFSNMMHPLAFVVFFGLSPLVGDPGVQWVLDVTVHAQSGQEWALEVGTIACAVLCYWCAVLALLLSLIMGVTDMMLYAQPANHVVARTLCSVLYAPTGITRMVNRIDIMVCGTHGAAAMFVFMKVQHGMQQLLHTQDVLGTVGFIMAYAATLGVQRCLDAGRRSALHTQHCRSVTFATVAAICVCNSAAFLLCHTCFLLVLPDDLLWWAPKRPSSSAKGKAKARPRGDPPPVEQPEPKYEYRQSLNFVENLIEQGLDDKAIRQKLIDQGEL